MKEEEGRRFGFGTKREREREIDKNRIIEGGGEWKGEGGFVMDDLRIKFERRIGKDWQRINRERSIIYNYKCMQGKEMYFYD